MNEVDRSDLLGNLVCPFHPWLLCLLFHPCYRGYRCHLVDLSDLFFQSDLVDPEWKKYSYAHIRLVWMLPLDPLVQSLRWHLYRHEFLSDPNEHRRVSQQDLFIARGRSVVDLSLISTRDYPILYSISDGSLNALLANDSFGTDKTDITFVAQDSFVTLVAYREKNRSLVNIALMNSK